MLVEFFTSLFLSYVLGSSWLQNIALDNQLLDISSLLRACRRTAFDARYLTVSKTLVYGYYPVALIQLGHKGELVWN